MQEKRDITELKTPSAITPATTTMTAIATATATGSFSLWTSEEERLLHSLVLRYYHSDQKQQKYHKSKVGEIMNEEEIYPQNLPWDKIAADLQANYPILISPTGNPPNNNNNNNNEGRKKLSKLQPIVYFIGKN